jgi:hemerythrin
MPLLTWNDDYSVNNDELDSHHKKLISILNHIVRLIHEYFANSDNTYCR